MWGLPSLLMSRQPLLMEHQVGTHTSLEARENKHSGPGACPCHKCSQAHLSGCFPKGQVVSKLGGSCNYTQAACRVLDGDSPTRMRVSGSVIWPEAERNCLPRRSPFRPCHRLFPGDSQVWPKILGKRGKGGVSAPRALARPRGDRKPGHRGLSLASTKYSPAPAWEEVLPSALRRLYC